MKLYTTDFITGKEIETLQMVRGSVVFSKNVVRDVFAGLKTLVGGEIAGYTEMLNDARNIAVERMENQAGIIGADAAQQPVGRVGKPEDIAEMALFLCSEKAGFITGENVCIDGGMTRQMIYHGEHGWNFQE